MSVERILRPIMALPRNEREVPLRQLAQELGCSLSGTYTSEGRHLENEVIQRIRDADGAGRESLWWSVPRGDQNVLELIALIVAVLGAVAAWIAVFP